MTTNGTPSGRHPLANGIAPEVYARQQAIADLVLGAEARPGQADDAELAQELANDLGNARRLIARHGGDIAFCEEIGWLAWDGTRWQADGGDAQATIRAQKTSEAIFTEAATLPPFDEEEPPKADKEAHKRWRAAYARYMEGKNAFLSFALQSGNKARCEAMLAAAAPHLRIKHADLDANPYLLNCLNGTLDLKQGPELFAHRRSDWITKRVSVAFDAAAECPNWRKFIAEILPEATGEGRARFFQKVLGYALSGDISEQKVVQLEGKGANGKSTAMEVVARIIGDYGAVTPIETFLHQERRSGSGPSPDIARLPGARLVRASEPEPGARLSESVIKQWTGGERMIARHLHRDFFEFTPMGKLVLSVNIRPVLVGKDHGIRRRILVVPFLERFDTAARDRAGSLVEDLMAEASGILNWLLEGFWLWLDEGLAPPKAVTDATEAYFTEMDPIGTFVREALTQTDIGSDLVPAAEVFAAYKNWCGANNEDEKTQTAFGRRLGDLGFRKGSRMGRVFYTGVQLDEAWRPSAAAANRGAKEGDAGK